jgi:hypothetical protein
MARKLNKLTARGVATATKPGRHSDGGGLYLKVDAGRKAWVFRYTMASRVRENLATAAGRSADARQSKT